MTEIDDDLWDDDFDDDQPDYRFSELVAELERNGEILRQWESGDPLIDICFDADRLDLFYRGITPDPALMATEIGSYYAEHYDEYLTDIQKIRI